MNRRALLLAAGLLIISCSRAPKVSPAASAEAAIPVTLAAVMDTALVQPIAGTGVLGAKEEVPLGFKIGGVVAMVGVDAGDRVAAGQLLASLEQPEIAGEVARAQAGLQQAERDLARAQALYRDSVIARDRLEAAETGAEVARAGARIARFNEQYAVIRAPSAGTVLRRLAEPGQQLPPGMPVLLLASAGRGQVVRVGLADRDAGRVRVGDPAVVTFDANAGQRYDGRIARIAAAATPGSGAWEIEVRLDRRVGIGSDGLASGLIGRVVISPRGTTTLRMIPLGALLEADGDSGMVYVVRDSGATGSAAAATSRRLQVQVAFVDGDRAAIRGGLDGIAEVIVAGAGFLRDGARVDTAAAPLVSP